MQQSPLHFFFISVMSRSSRGCAKCRAQLKYQCDSVLLTSCSSQLPAFTTEPADRLQPKPVSPHLPSSCLRPLIFLSTNQRQPSRLSNDVILVKGQTAHRRTLSPQLCIFHHQARPKVLTYALHAEPACLSAYRPGTVLLLPTP